LLEYVINAKWHGWSVQVLSVATAIQKGYTISQIREAIEGGQNLKDLPVLGNDRSGGGDAITNNWALIPTFSITNFHSALVDFIVADDQVLNHFF
jgi:hypothetical protein